MVTSLGNTAVGVIQLVREIAMLENGFLQFLHAFFLKIPSSRVLDSSISGHVLVLFFLDIFLSRVA